MERTYYLTPQERFEALGKQLLPFVPVPPAFNFRTCARSGSLLLLSGHGRNRAKRPPEFNYFGTMGAELTPEQGNVATRLVGLNLLRTVEYALGALDRIEAIVEVVGAVTSAPGFTGQSFVLSWGQRKGPDSMTGPCYCNPFNPRVLTVALTVYFSDACSPFIADSSSSAQMGLVSRSQVEVRSTTTQTKHNKE